MGLPAPKVSTVWGVFGCRGLRVEPHYGPGQDESFIARCVRDRMQSGSNDLV